MNDYYFTSDLHLGHQTLLKGYRSQFFNSMEEHNETIVNNLLSLPRGSNLVIAGDLFWRYNSKQVKDFFDKFQKHRIELHLIRGNHDKVSQWKHKVVKSISEIKEIKVDKQSITICHYPLVVFNRSHYSNSMQLYGHIHKNDSTWNRINENPLDNRLSGKKLNINIELHDFKPWNFEEIKEYMDKQEDNWDLIKR